MKTLLKTKHFELREDHKTLFFSRDELAEECVVYIEVKPYGATTENIEDIEIRYGLSGNGKSIGKDKAIKDMVEVLQDALVIAEKARKYLNI